jgi:hypothetical protein
LIDLEVLFHGARIRAAPGRIHVAGRKLFDVKILGRGLAMIDYRDYRQYIPPQPRFWRGGGGLVGVGEEVVVARTIGGMAGEIRGFGMHGVVEVQDGVARAHVRRLVEGL